jgi:glyoxylase I family protein
MFRGLHHASLLVSDLAKARAFYEGVLGLQPDTNRPQMSFDGVWYNIAPGQQIHLLVLPNPDAGSHRPSHGGRDRHVALAVNDMAKVLACLDKAGVAYTQSQSGRHAVFCRDPDQNALEFVVI